MQRACAPPLSSRAPCTRPAPPSCAADNTNGADWPGTCASGSKQSPIAFSTDGAAVRPACGGLFRGSTHGSGRGLQAPRALILRARHTCGALKRRGATGRGATIQLVNTQHARHSLAGLPAFSAEARANLQLGVVKGLKVINTGE